MSYKFYYDSLLEDEDLTYTIYAKSSTKENDTNNFVSSDNNAAKLDFSQKSGLTEVFTDFIQNPISLSISHGYEGGGWSLENMGENFFANLKSMSIRYQSLTEEAWNTLAQFVNKMGTYDNTTKFNKVLSSSDYYKAWTGGEVSIPLNFEARIYSREVNGSLKTPTEIVTEINKYFIPKAVRSTSSKSSAFTVIQPPNGYNASQRDQLNPRGTFCLRYGKKKMANLLLYNYQFQMSREVNSEGSSLYADVAFNFVPATYITSYEVNDFLGNQDYVGEYRLGAAKPMDIVKPSTFNKPGNVEVMK